MGDFGSSGIGVECGIRSVCGWDGAHSTDHVAAAARFACGWDRADPADYVATATRFVCGWDGADSADHPAAATLSGIGTARWVIREVRAEGEKVLGDSLPQLC